MTEWKGIERRRPSQAPKRPGRVVRPYLGRGLLFVIGIGIIGLGFAQFRGGDPLSLAALGLGCAMVFAACLLPWIASLRAGGQAGLDVKFRDPKDVAVTTALARRRDGSPAPPLPANDATEGAQFLLAEIALATIFRDNEVLPDCRFHLYLPDQAGLLSTVLELGIDPGLPPPESWPAGHGVVGKAWSKDAFIRAVGPECHDDSHGLTPEQQARYAATQVIAAIPVNNSRADIIGVVSAASLQKDSRLADQDGYDELVVVAQLAARVLIDVLKWFED